MLKPQKELLARVREVEKEARDLYDAGVKLSGVFQKLRSAGDELETRVRYIEKNTAPKNARSKPPEPTGGQKSEIQNPQS